MPCSFLTFIRGSGFTAKPSRMGENSGLALELALAPNIPVGGRCDRSLEGEANGQTFINSSNQKTQMDSAPQTMANSCDKCDRLRLQTHFPRACHTQGAW